MEARIRALEKRYRYLFTLPSVAFQVPVLVAILTLLLSTSGYPLVSTNVLLFFILFLSWPAFDKLVLQSEDSVTTKRLYGLSLFSTMFSIAAYPIFFALGSAATNAEALLLFELEIRFLFLYFCTSKRLPASAILAAVKVALLHHLLLGGFTLIHMLSYAVALCAAVLLVALLRRIGDGEDSINKVKAFVRLWLVKDGSRLEDFLKKEATTRSVTVKAMLFFGDEGKLLGAVVSPGVHPGPINNVGGSSLPRKLAEKFESFLQVPVLVCHSASTHALDPVDSSVADVVFSSIAEKLKGARAPSKSDSFLVRFGRANDPPRVCILGSKSVQMVTISMAPYLSDDLPEEVGASVERMLKARNAKAVVVDAHNSFSKVEKPLDPGEVLRRVSAQVEEASPKRLRVYFGPIDTSEFDSREITTYGARMLLLQDNEREYCFLLFDSNNIEADLYQKLIEALEEVGIAGEVLTTDTHELTGRFPGSGYVPLGHRTDHDLVVSRVRRAVNEGRSRLRALKAMSLVEAEVKVDVLGEDGLERVVAFAKKVSDVVSKALPAVLILPIAFRALLILLARF